MASTVTPPAPPQEPIVTAVAAFVDDGSGGKKKFALVPAGLRPFEIYQVEDTVSNGIFGSKEQWRWACRIPEDVREEHVNPNKTVDEEQGYILSFWTNRTWGSVTPAGIINGRTAKSWDWVESIMGAVNGMEVLKWLGAGGKLSPLAFVGCRFLGLVENRRKKAGNGDMGAFLVKALAAPEYSDHNRNLFHQFCLGNDPARYKAVFGK